MQGCAGPPLNVADWQADLGKGFGPHLE